MLGRSLDLTFATFLLALSFPILLLSSAWMRWSARGKKLVNQFGLPYHDQKNSFICSRMDEGPNFDRAIAEYEELIDATVSGAVQ
jgi:hypothetical protein